MRCSTIIEKYLGAWPWGTIVSTTLSICHCTTLIAKSGYGDCRIFLDRLEYSDLHKVMHSSVRSTAATSGCTLQRFGGSQLAEVHQVLLVPTLNFLFANIQLVFAGTAILAPSRKFLVVWTHHSTPQPQPRPLKPQLTKFSWIIPSSCLSLLSPQ